LLLCPFNQRYDIAHPKDPVGHSAGIEDIDGINFLSDADELNWFIDNSPDRQSRSSPCVTIQFSQNNAIIVETLVEGFGSIDGILASTDLPQKGFAMNCIFYS
jgi:hypothetical protein